MLEAKMVICPQCNIEHDTEEEFCKKCGKFLLIVEDPDLEEKKKLETCMNKLETQRNRISGDVINPLSIRYQDRLKSLSPRHQEIEIELHSIKKRTSEEVDVLEKELKPIQKRLEEFKFLYKLGAVTNDDLVREKKEMKKEIKSREKSLRKHRQILSLLPSKM